MTDDLLRCPGCGRQTLTKLDMGTTPDAAFRPDVFRCTDADCPGSREIARRMTGPMPTKAGDAIVLVGTTAPPVTLCVVTEAGQQGCGAIYEEHASVESAWLSTSGGRVFATFGDGTWERYPSRSSS